MVDIASIISTTYLYYAVIFAVTVLILLGLLKFGINISKKAIFIIGLYYVIEGLMIYFNTSWSSIYTLFKHFILKG